jgi:general secretion pathway protein L
VKRGATHRLLTFLPPQGVVLEDGGRVSLTAATVVGYSGIDASRRRCGGGDAPLSLLPKAPEVDLLFDVSDVFTALLDAPPMSERRLRQALPGLIEDRLLTDAADCHVAYHSESSEGSLARVAVAAIDRGTLTRALEAAVEAEVRPRRAYSALYSIPAPAADTLSVRVARGRGTVRTAEHSGFAFDAEPGMLAALSITVQQLGIKRIRVYGCDAAKLRRLAVPLRVEVMDAKRDFDTKAIASAVDLLQGRFAPAGGFGMPAVAALARSGYAKPLLAWGALGLAIWVVGLNAYRFKLEAESRAQRVAMQTAFRSAFPSEAVVEPVAQAQRHLRELRARAGKSSPDDFSVLNAQAAQLISNAPIGALAGIEYRDAALTLKFKRGAADSATFQDALRAQAAPQGLKVQFNADASARIVPASP